MAKDLPEPTKLATDTLAFISGLISGSTNGVAALSLPQAVELAKIYVQAAVTPEPPAPVVTPASGGSGSSSSAKKSDDE